MNQGVYEVAAASAGLSPEPTTKELLPDGLMTVGAGMALPLTTSELERLNQAVKGLEESLAAANDDLGSRKAALVAAGAALKRVGEAAADSAGAEDRGMELRAIGAEEQDALAERAVPLVLGELDDLAFLRRKVHDLEGSHSDALADLAAEREECAELEASLGKTSAQLAAAEVSDLPLVVPSEWVERCCLCSSAREETLKPKSYQKQISVSLCASMATDVTLVKTVCVQAEVAALSPFRKLSKDVQETVLAQPDAGQSPLPPNLSPEDECAGVVAMVEDALGKMHSKAAADWMNLSAELKDADLKARDIQESLEGANQGLAAARDLANELQAERNALCGRLGDAERDLEQANLAHAASLAAAKDEIAAGERQMADVMAELKTAEGEAKQLGEQVAAFLARMNDMEGELKAEREAGGEASNMVTPAAGLLSLTACFACKP